jgi:alpha-galactosidase
MYGEGNSAGLGAQTDVEYKTQFSIWCLMNSPLMIGCDVRSISKGALEILTNKELIAVNQDPEARAPYVFHQWDSEWCHTVVKPLSDGSYALGFFNFADEGGDRNASVQFWDMGLPAMSGYGFKLRDLWAHEDAGVVTEGMRVWVPSHGCKVYRAELVKTSAGGAFNLH